MCADEPSDFTHFAAMIALLVGGAYLFPGPEPIKWLMLGLAGLYAAAWPFFIVDKKGY